MANRPLPHINIIRQELSYNPITGVFTQNLPKGGRVAGSLAGGKSKTGHIQIRIRGVMYKAHRIAWMLLTGEDPGKFEIDHINMDPTDNRFVNLRIATSAENRRNTGARANGTTGFKGVSPRTGKGTFRARINYNGKSIYLGDYATAEEAHSAYCEAANKYHGEFARTG